VAATFTCGTTPVVCSNRGDLGQWAFARGLCARLTHTGACVTTFCIRCRSLLLTEGTIAFLRQWTNVALTFTCVATSGVPSKGGNLSQWACTAPERFANLTLTPACVTTICIRCRNLCLTEGTVALCQWTNVAFTFTCGATSVVLSNGRSLGQWACSAPEHCANLTLALACVTTFCILCRNLLLTKGAVALWRLCWTNVAIARTLITSLVVLLYGQCLGKGTLFAGWHRARLAFAFTCATTVLVHCGNHFLAGQTVTSGHDCWTDWSFTRTNLATILNLTHDSLLAERALIALQVFTSRDEVTSARVATILIF